VWERVREKDGRECGGGEGTQRAASSCVSPIQGISARVAYIARSLGSERSQSIEHFWHTTAQSGSVLRKGSS